MPAYVLPGAIVARGQAASVIRSAVDPVKLRAGKLDIGLSAGSAYLAVAKPEHLQAQFSEARAVWPVVGRIGFAALVAPRPCRPLACRRQGRSGRTGAADPAGGRGSA